MKKSLLFCSFVSLFVACRNETDIVPTSSLANEVAGTYRTNVYLDPSTVAISANQMPYIVLKAESDSSVNLTYTKAQISQIIEHVGLSRQTEGIQLRVANRSIGRLQTDRVFTNNGMEKQGQLLRLNAQIDSQNALNFAGSK